MEQINLNQVELLNLSEFVRKNLKQHISTIRLSSVSGPIGNTLVVTLLDRYDSVIAENDITDTNSW